MLVRYYYCNEDAYGQRTGTYESIYLSPYQVETDRYGNQKYNGHFLYEYEIQVQRACAS